MSQCARFAPRVCCLAGRGSVPPDCTLALGASNSHIQKPVTLSALTVKVPGRAPGALAGGSVRSACRTRSHGGGSGGSSGVGGTGPGRAVGGRLRDGRLCGVAALGCEAERPSGPPRSQPCPARADPGRPSPAPSRPRTDGPDRSGPGRGLGGGRQAFAWVIGLAYDGGHRTRPGGRRRWRRGPGDL